MATTNQTTRARKRAMLDAMRATFGIIKQAAEQVGINRTTHYLWLSKDKKYAAAIAELEEVKKDFVENKLLKLIENGDSPATTFAAKTLLKDRGYILRTEVTGKDGGPIKGDITHNVIFKNSKQDPAAAEADRKAAQGESGSMEEEDES